MNLNSNLRKLKILIVEDDATSRELLRRILDNVGDVDTFSDGTSAINAVKKAMEDNKPYDLVCLDINIPEASGHEVLSTIRTEEKKYGKEGIFRTRIIMTTSSNREDDVVGAYAQQCDAYCVKPIIKDVLFQKMEEIGFAKHIK
jgi:two-component system, chemotaxis family, chemotaxis protein CheY